SNPSTILITKYRFTCVTSVLLHVEGGQNGRLPLNAWTRSVLLLVHVNVFGVNHAFVFLLFACSVRRTAGGSASGGSRLRLRGFVHGFRQLVRGLGQPVACRVQHGGVRACIFQRLLGVSQRRLHAALLVA